MNQTPPPMYSSLENFSGRSAATTKAAPAAVSSPAAVNTSHGGSFAVDPLPLSGVRLDASVSEMLAGALEGDKLAPTAAELSAPPHIPAGAAVVEDSLSMLGEGDAIGLMAPAFGETAHNVGGAHYDDVDPATDAQLRAFMSDYKSTSKDVWRDMDEMTPSNTADEAASRDLPVGGCGATSKRTCTRRHPTGNASALPETDVTVVDNSVVVDNDPFDFIAHGEYMKQLRAIHDTALSSERAMGAGEADCNDAATCPHTSGELSCVSCGTVGTRAFFADEEAFFRTIGEGSALEALCRHAERVCPTCDLLVGGGEQMDMATTSAATSEPAPLSSLAAAALGEIPEFGGGSAYGGIHRGGPSAVSDTLLNRFARPNNASDLPETDMYVADGTETDGHVTGGAEAAGMDAKATPHMTGGRITREGYNTGAGDNWALAPVMGSFSARNPHMSLFRVVQSENTGEYFMQPLDIVARKPVRMTVREERSPFANIQIDQLLRPFGRGAPRKARSPLAHGDVVYGAMKPEDAPAGTPSQIARFRLSLAEPAVNGDERDIGEMMHSLNLNGDPRNEEALRSALSSLTRNNLPLTAMRVEVGGGRRRAAVMSEFFITKNRVIAAGDFGMPVVQLLFCGGDIWRLNRNVYLSNAAAILTALRSSDNAEYHEAFAMFIHRIYVGRADLAKHMQEQLVTLVAENRAEVEQLFGRFGAHETPKPTMFAGARQNEALALWNRFRRLLKDTATRRSERYASNALDGVLMNAARPLYYRGTPARAIRAAVMTFERAHAYFLSGVVMDTLITSPRFRYKVPNTDMAQPDGTRSLLQQVFSSAMELNAELANYIGRFTLNERAAVETRTPVRGDPTQTPTHATPRQPGALIGADTFSPGTNISRLVEAIGSADLLEDRVALVRQAEAVIVDANRRLGYTTFSGRLARMGTRSDAETLNTMFEEAVRSRGIVVESVAAEAVVGALPAELGGNLQYHLPDVASLFTVVTKRDVIHEARDDMEYDDNEIIGGMVTGPSIFVRNSQLLPLRRTVGGGALEVPVMTALWDALSPSGTVSLDDVESMRALNTMPVDVPPLTASFYYRGSDHINNDLGYHIATMGDLFSAETTAFFRSLAPQVSSSTEPSTQAVIKGLLFMGIVQQHVDGGGSADPASVESVLGNVRRMPFAEFTSVLDPMRLTLVLHNPEQFYRRVDALAEAMRARERAANPVIFTFSREDEEPELVDIDSNNDGVAPHEEHQHARAVQGAAYLAAAAIDNSASSTEQEEAMRTPPLRARRRPVRPGGAEASVYGDEPSLHEHGAGCHGRSHSRHRKRGAGGTRFL